MRKKTIDIRNLSIGYNSKNGRKTVAENLNTALYQGELTCLLGVNGIGKSTLLKTLSGFLDRIGGDILINDRNIDSFSEKDLSMQVSIVLTEKVMIQNMTARELIGMGRSPYNGFWGRISKDDEKIVEQCIEMVNINHLKNRYIDNLSDGERQKVMIAKALAQDTSIILLDEPTAFLDFPSKVEIVHLLHRLTRETNKSIFLSTHDLELALQSADKLWLMDKNSKIHIGSPEDLALEGVLSSFFYKKGIFFDEYSGLFRIQNQTNKQIKLIGEGIRYLMMQKALLRTGIKADTTQESPDFIVVTDDFFELHTKNGKVLYKKTIDSVLECLFNHIKR